MPSLFTLEGYDPVLLGDLLGGLGSCGCGCGGQGACGQVQLGESLVDWVRGHVWWTVAIVIVPIVVGAGVGYAYRRRR